MNEHGGQIPVYGVVFLKFSGQKNHRNTHCHVSVVEVLFLFTFDLLFLLCSPDVVTSDLHISCCLAGCAALMVPFSGILGGLQLFITYR